MWSFRASASNDVKQYLEHYPGQKQYPNQRKNIEFYDNKRKSVPDGDYIDNIHSKWFGNYQLLEIHHAYIQWLFPIRENGLNIQAQKLQLHEIIAITSNKQMKERVKKSYELMLDFYGFQLVDAKSGKLGRSTKYEQRFKHLNSSMHNCLRITRILKCLGELGYEYYKFPFCLAVIQEIRNGYFGRIIDSALNYWFPVLRYESDRKLLHQIWELKRTLTDSELDNFITQAMNERKAIDLSVASEQQEDDDSVQSESCSSSVPPSIDPQCESVAKKVKLTPTAATSISTTVPSSFEQTAAAASASDSDGDSDGDSDADADPDSDGYGSRERSTVQFSLPVPVSQTGEQPRQRIDQYFFKPTPNPNTSEQKKELQY